MLLQVGCADGLTLSVRVPSSAPLTGNLEFEFFPADAVPVRQSEERV